MQYFLIKTPEGIANLLFTIYALLSNFLDHWIYALFRPAPDRPADFHSRPAPPRRFLPLPRPAEKCFAPHIPGYDLLTQPKCKSMKIIIYKWVKPTLEGGVDQFSVFLMQKLFWSTFVAARWLRGSKLANVITDKHSWSKTNIKKWGKIFAYQEKNHFDFVFFWPMDYMYRFQWWF